MSTRPIGSLWRGAMPGPWRSAEISDYLHTLQILGIAWRVFPNSLAGVLLGVKNLISDLRKYG